MYYEDNFTRAIDEALTEEYLNSIPQVENHEFSKKFQRQMSRLVKRRDRPFYRLTNTTRKKVVCIIALCVILSTITVMSVDALREKVFDFFITTFQKCSTVQYDVHGQDYPTSIKEVYSIGYNLSDYIVVYEYTDGDEYNVVYNQGNTTIDFSQQVKTNYDVNYNTENAHLEEITINTWNGIFFEDNHGYGNLILDVDNYIVSICANVPKEQLVEIAKTINK